MQDYDRYDALALGELVRTKQVRAEELLDAAAAVFAAYKRLRPLVSGAAPPSS